MVEAQLKDVLYGMDAPPRILGKADEKGAPLLPETGELDPMQIARVLAGRIERFFTTPRIADRMAYLAARERQPESKGADRAHPLFLLGLPAQHLDPRPRG